MRTRHACKLQLGALTSWRRNGRIRGDGDAARRIIAWKLEVTNSHSRETIECLERDILRELDAIKDGAQSSDAETVCRDNPGELLVVQQVRRERRERILVSNRQVAARYVVGDTAVRSSTDFVYESVWV